jgi:hypothetical protein
MRESSRISSEGVCFSGKKTVVKQMDPAAKFKIVIYTIIALKKLY